MVRFPRRSLSVVALVGVTVVAACSDAPTQLPSSAPSLKRASTPTGEFMILGAGGALPADLAAQVDAAGGTLIREYAGLGLAVATARSTGFAANAARIGGVESVTEDRMMDFVDPDLRVVEFEGEVASPVDQVASIGDNERFFPIQWALPAINAPEAWNAGYTGTGVRVAILDGGIHSTHQDLSANLDAAASRSFVPGRLFNQDVGTFWHGTHVAGIVAAADNGLGTIGVAPSATIIGVKVLHNGTGSFSWLIDGVIYAAKSRAEGGAGAQVINMSLGAWISDAKDQAIKKDLKELTKALDRAMSYAWKQGVTVIAAAGNDGVNFDDAKFDISIPAQSQHVVSIASTAPIGWALGNREFARLASYTNWGKAVVDLAAPGGDFAYPGNQLCTMQTAGLPLTFPCWVFDMYISTSRGGATSISSYTWAAGTSMASPVAAGVAALIIQKGGAGMSPALVEAELRRGAFDLGKPGNDAVYGHGWVNAFNSVR